MNAIETTADSVKERARRKLERDAGPLFLSALTDSRTVEILVNQDGSLWQERLGEPLTRIGSMRPAQTEAIIRTVAGYHGLEITPDSPLVEGEFPIDGSRFAGQLQPVVLAPTFALRKRAVAVYTLDQYVADGIMTAAHKASIIDAIIRHRNILVIGGTGSGKTTLVNAIIKAMVDHKPTERFVIIEDTGEIQCTAQNYVQYHTSMSVSMTMLLKTTLRMRPDRISVGEVRGAEALDLLMAWNTGHEGGVATLHANNARAGLDRMKMLISMHPNAPALIEHLIAQAVHVVIHIARAPTGRRVEEILAVDGYEDGRYITHVI